MERVRAHRPRGAIPSTTPASPSRSRSPGGGRFPVGAVVEWSGAVEDLGGEVGRLMARAGGAALFIDYGTAGDDLRGDTLQAVRRHQKACALAHPGAADLTAQVRFGPFLAKAGAAGALTAPVVTQADFLARLGIEARAAALAKASPGQAGRIGRQLHRLTDEGEMGVLFKVACIHAPGLSPPGFAP